MSRRHNSKHALQKAARRYAEIHGCKYTEALRQVRAGAHSTPTRQTSTTVIDAVHHGLDHLIARSLDELPIAPEDLTDLDLPHGLTVLDVRAEDRNIAFNVDEHFEPDLVIGHVVVPHRADPVGVRSSC